MRKVFRLKNGIPVFLFVSWFSCSIVTLNPLPAYCDELSSAETQLMSVEHFDSKAESALRKYLAGDKTSKQATIQILVKHLDALMKEYAENAGGDHKSYMQVQNYLKLILQSLSPLSDSMTGAQIQLILQSLGNSDIIMSESLNPIYKTFIEAFKSAPLDRETLPAELKNQQVQVLNELVRDSLVDRLLYGSLQFYGQEELYKDLLKTLIRPHTSVPILVEPSFSGKTEFLLDVTRRLMLRDYPPNPVFQRTLKNAAVLHLNAKKMEPGMLLPSFEAINNLKYSMKRPILIIIENVQSLLDRDPASFVNLINSIKRVENEKMKFVLTTDPEGMGRITKTIGSASADELLQKLNFAPLSDEDFIRVAKERLATDKSLVDDLGVKFSGKAVEKLAKFVLEQKDTELSPLMRMRRHLENVAVSKLADDPFSDGTISDKDVRGYINRIAGVSFSVDDPQSIASYYMDLEQKISQEIAGQDRMIREVLDVHRDLLVNANAKRPLRVVGMVGPTGVGKTELAKVLARVAYGKSSHSLRIDGTAYMDKANIFKLLGPTIGYKDSEQKGQLIEYLEGAGKNGGVILIDEGEKACPEFWQALMSLFEEGFVIGGDGKPRFLHNHLVVITSNRGDKQLYPKGFDTWPKEQQKSHLEGFKQDQLKSLFTQTTGEKNDVVFPDYIIQRIDRFVAANQASLDVALTFVPRLVNRIKENIFETYSKTLEVDNELVDTYVRSNFKATAGYRPLFRSIEFNFKRIVLDILAKMSKDDNRIHLNLVENDKGKAIGAEYSDSQPPMVFDFPSSEEDNVFRDPHIFERLAKLPELIKKGIIGQDHIIDPLVAAVQKHVIKSQNSRRSPLAFFTIGPTGTGKTELAKVLAQALMGSSDRVGIIPMGEINSRSKWANYFGGDVGYQGSDVMRLFEQILRSNPQGGVIVLDEASNVGGQDKELKTELLKLLYNMIEEGKWISPTTGIEYDLSRYIFLLTGNDGQELYHGASDENLREATWARNNKPERIMEILVKAGVPEPLLGRMASLFWARPLSKEEMQIVATKFLDKAVAEMGDRQIKLVYDSHFVEQLVAHSYSVMMGARSVRNYVENALGGLLAQIEIKAFENKVSLVGSTVELSFGDSQKRLPIVTEKNKAPSDIFIHGTVKPEQGDLFEHNLNTKAFLAPHGTQTLRQAYETAVHEAGHALVNDYANVGLKILSITIDASGGHLGYVNYEENPHLNWNRQRVIARIASQFAGGLAQQMAGIGLDAGWSSDLEGARTFATQAIVRWGLGNELDSIFYPQDKDGKPQLNQQVLEREVDALMREAYELSKKTLAANWKVLQLTAKKLMKQYTLSQEEWELIKQERPRGKAEYERATVDGVDRMVANPVRAASRSQVPLCIKSLNALR